MKTLNEPKKLNTKQLRTLLNMFTHKELKIMAKTINAPTGKDKSSTIGSLVNHRTILGNHAIALDIS